MENKEQEKQQSRKWMDREEVRPGWGLESQLYSAGVKVESAVNYQESEGGELAYANWN